MGEKEKRREREQRRIRARFRYQRKRGTGEKAEVILASDSKLHILNKGEEKVG